MKPVAFVYRDQEQIMQVYINEFEEEGLDRLEEEGMLFFAEYPGGHFRRVSRGEVVNPNPSYTGTVRIYQKEDAGT